jgi:hypothetical protein
MTILIKTNSQNRHFLKIQKSVANTKVLIGIKISKQVLS